MPVDRAKWTGWFRWQDLPPWPCPSCAEGHLKPQDNVAPIEAQTARSRLVSNHPAYDPVDDYGGRFAALLKCTVCSDVVVLAGASGLGYFQTPDDPYNAETVYSPSFFLPAPALFRIPRECPPAVKKELDRAWTLFWVDRAACANRIRSCMETILNGAGIAQYRRTGKRTPLTLHARIEKYRAREPHLAEEMMAVKWLGNAGSHAASELDADAVCDGFDLLEHVLEEVYARRTRTLARIRRDLIRRKGRPKSARRTKLT